MPYNATWIEPWMRPLKQQTRKRTRGLTNTKRKSVIQPLVELDPKPLKPIERTSPVSKSPEKEVKTTLSNRSTNVPSTNVRPERHVVLKETYHLPKKRSEKVQGPKLPRRATRNRRTSSKNWTKVLAVKASEKKDLKARAEKAAQKYKPLGIKI